MATVAELVGQLGSSDQAEAYKAFQALSLMAAEAGAPDNSEKRAELAAQLAAELNAKNETKNDRGNVSSHPKYSAEVRCKVCRVLAEVGDEQTVPALVASLDDFEVREMARWSLSRNPSQAATAALVKIAQEGIGPEYRVGAVNALARRHGVDVINALNQCALDADPEVRTAAAESLAEHAVPSSDAVLAAAQAHGAPNDRIRSRLAKARIRLADVLARDGQPAAAKQIYEAILKDGTQEPQKDVARRSLEQLG